MRVRPMIVSRRTIRRAVSRRSHLVLENRSFGIRDPVRPGAATGLGTVQSSSIPNRPLSSVTPLLASAESPFSSSGRSLLHRVFPGAALADGIRILESRSKRKKHNPTAAAVVSFSLNKSLNKNKFLCKRRVTKPITYDP